MTGPAEPFHGPMLIGTMINIFLYGIMVAQVYIYYTTYKRDHFFLKIFVFTLLFVDAINTVFEMVYIYMCLIPHFGDVKYLVTLNWTAEIAPVSTGIITLMAQLFYAWRIHVLTRNWFLVAVVVLLSVTSAVFAMVSAWQSIVKFPEISKLQGIQNVAIVWLTCAVVADIVITTILRKHRSGFQKTDMMINRIIRITMQTCLATTVIATVELTLFLSMSSGTHILFLLILCKFYSNSLVSSLNSRGGWNYDTPTNLECESNFMAHGVSNPTTSGQVDTTASQPSTIKPETSLDSMVFGKKAREGVVVHVASHGMRDMALRGKDPEA